MARKKYLEYLPVSSDMTADLLKTDAVWECLKTIRSKGLEGVTAEEIVKETGQPLSTIYGALSKLWHHGFVRRQKRRKGMPERGLRVKGLEREKVIKGRMAGKSPREYLESCDILAAFESRRTEPENPWGDVIFSWEFEHEIGPIIREKLESIGFSDQIEKFVNELCGDIKNRKRVAHLMPSAEICSVCGRSHESNEFVKAVLLYIATHTYDSKADRLLRELQVQI